MAQRLELLGLAGLPPVQPGDDLLALLTPLLREAAPANGDCLVLAQKIFSKAENRYVDLADITPGEQALQLAPKVDKDPRLVELILRESVDVVAHRPGALIVEHKLGYVHANAGIDKSNIEHPAGGERVLLLPENPDASARALREGLRETLGVELAVIINDSAGRAWRNGTMGFAIGTAGFEPVWDLVGDADMFGRPLEITQVAVADELAAAASFVMGQAAEGVPAVLVRGARLPAAEVGSGALIRKREEDLFR